MADAPSFRTPRLFLFAFLCLWFVGLTLWWNNPHSLFEQRKIPGLPFGFLRAPEGGIEVQDFSYNLVFFRGIRDHVVQRPYRLQDQEALVRKLVPGMEMGLSHGYSPVAYVLALPLLEVPGSVANLLLDATGAAGIILLFYFYLLPRTTTPAQLLALGLTMVSICLVLTVALSQSTLVTTSLLGLFWVLLQRREGRPGLDLTLALLFWALCLKPNVALIPLILLLGARAWRPLIFGFALLGITWAFTGPLYGGWITGLRDYAYLLNHYNNADFTPFMRRNYVPGHDAQIRGLFAFDRITMLVLSLALLVLHWTRRISLSHLFQGMIVTFLLFSPYLLPSEDWIICLLVVENDFFLEANPLAAFAKLFLLIGIMDLRGGMIVPWELNFQFKCLFFGWMFAEAIMRRNTSFCRPEPEINR